MVTVFLFVLNCCIERLIHGYSQNVTVASTLIDVVRQQ